MTSGNLLASNKSINDPFETFLALNHFDNELSLNDLVILENVRFELLVATTDLRNHIVCFLFKMDFVQSNQIKRALDVHNWNSNIVLLNQLLQVLFKLDVSSRNEFYRRLYEKGLTLVINFSVRNTCILSVALNVMFVLSVLINLLLLYSSYHLFLLNIDILQFLIQSNFFIMIELDKFLPLHFLSLASLANHLILLIPQPIIFISFTLQIYLPSLPQILMLSLSDYLKAPFFSFVQKLVILLKQMVVFLNSSLNTQHIRRASWLTLSNNLFNFSRVEPKLGLLKQGQVSNNHSL